MGILRVFFSLIFTVMSAGLFGNPHTLHFDDLSAENALENSSLWGLSGKVVQLRGFWYPLSSHEGILSSQIDLKSCCLKDPAKIQQQILVEGNVDGFAAGKALTMEGIFKIQPRHNLEGELVQLFVLEQAKVIDQSNLSSYLIVGVGLILLSVSFYLRGRIFRSYRKRG